METIAVVLIVAGAAGFVIWRAVRAVLASRKSAAGCGSCGCGSGERGAAGMR